MAKEHWGVVGIAVDDRCESAVHIQELLTAHGDIIVGRMGVPRRDKQVCLISLIVAGEKAHIDELAAKLADVPGVRVVHVLAPLQ